MIGDRGKRVQWAMERRGVRKIYSLAVDSGVDQSTLCRWTKGSPISLENAVRFCEVLDVSLDWLLLGRGDFEQHKPRDVTAEEWRVVDDLRRLPPRVAATLAGHVEALSREVEREGAVEGSGEVSLEAASVPGN